MEYARLLGELREATEKGLLAVDFHFRWTLSAGNASTSSEAKYASCGIFSRCFSRRSRHLTLQSTELIFSFSVPSSKASVRPRSATARGRLRTRRPGTGTAITRPIEELLRLLAPPKTTVATPCTSTSCTSEAHQPPTESAGYFRSDDCNIFFLLHSLCLLLSNNYFENRLK